MKYSVLMSVYFKEKPEQLAFSLESMVNQTRAPSQIVIVEDGPLTAELYMVIEKFKKDCPNLIDEVKLLNNSGLAIALNEGLKHCNNELVARMDSDDFSLPSRCEKELECFENNPNLSLVGTNVDEFIGNTDNIVARRKVPSNQQDIIKFSRRRNPFNHPSVMFKKEDVLAFGGYNPERKRAQDYELFATMVNNGCLALNIDESLVMFRVGNESIKRRKKWEHCNC